MRKILFNIKFKMKYQFTWAVWYLFIYGVVMLLLYYALMKTNLISATEGSLVYRIWGLVIFQFAVTMRFKEDFDFFLTLSNTREQFFHSLLGTSVGFSVIFSAIIVLEKVVVDSLNIKFGFQNISDPLHFFAPYATNNLFVRFVFFLVLSVCCSVCALLLGSLFYRFGRKFTLAFWLFFSSIPIIFLPIVLWSINQRGNLSAFIAATGRFFTSFDVMAASGYLLMLAIVFGFAAFLNIRRLPQK